MMTHWEIELYGVKLTVSGQICKGYMGDHENEPIPRTLTIFEICANDLNIQPILNVDIENKIESLILEDYD